MIRTIPSSTHLTWWFPARWLARAGAQEERCGPPGKPEKSLGFVKLMADTLVPEIFLDVLLRKINGLSGRKSRVLPIYWGFSY
jgi:hypothetical protein